MKEISENVKAIDVVRQMVADGHVSKDVAEKYFPELKDSEDETIRKVLIQYFSTFKLGTFAGLEPKKIIDWLEKQKEFVSADFDDVWETADCNELTAPLEKYSKDAIKEMCHAWYDKGIELERRNWLEKKGTPAKLSEEEQNRFAKGVLSSCALSFIDYLDAHKHEGKMCVSNGECEDIENAFHNAMWDRLHRYYCKYIEKQGEQKPILDVEIPFGAKDSELEEVFYSIPNGFHAEIKDDKVVIKKGAQKPWSEEVERKINRIYSILGQAADTHAFSTNCRLIGDKECVELQDFLKSLKERMK